MRRRACRPAAGATRAVRRRRARLAPCRRHHGHVLVGGQLLLRFAPDRGLVVQRALVMLEYDARRQPTSSVLSKIAASRCGGTSSPCLPALGRRQADPLDRDARVPTRPASPRPRRRSGSWRRRGRTTPWASRSKSSRARGECWLSLAPRPTTGRPDDVPGSGPHRAAGGPRRAPPRAPSSGAGRSRSLRARRRWCAGWRWPGSWNIGHVARPCRRAGPSHMYGQNTIGNSSPLLRWIVITCTASASDSRRRARSSFSLSRAASWIRRPSQVAMAVGPEALGHAGLVQQLGNVAQVRHEPLARRARQHPLGHLVRAADGLVERGDALVTQQRRPAVQRPVQRLPLGFVCRGHLFGRPAHEAGQGGQRGAVPCRRPLQRLRGGGATRAPGRWRRPSRIRRSPPGRRRRAARRGRSRPGCSSAPARRGGRDAPSCARLRRRPGSG